MAGPPNAAVAADGRRARLLARAFAGMGPALRARVIECLLRPLGALGVAAVASGAFVGYLQRFRPGAIEIAVEQAAAHSPGQVAELAQFAAQVDAGVWLQVLTLLAEAGPGSVAGLGLAALLLLARPGRRDGGEGLR